MMLADLPSLEPAQRAVGIAVDLARYSHQLRPILELRQEAYARHARPIDLRDLDTEDYSRGTAVLYVEVAGVPVATLRVTFGDFTDKYQLPERLHHMRLCAFERLAVRPGIPARGAMQSKWAVFKAAYLIAMGSSLDGIILSTVAPLDREFARYGFETVGEVDLPWYGGTQRLMFHSLADAPQRLLATSPTMYHHIVTPDDGPCWVAGHYLAGRQRYGAA